MKSLDAVTIGAMWGDRQRTRAKEIILCVLLPGHRISPAMKVPYLRITWLAATCKNQRPSQYMIQAIWEQNESPPMTGPVGRALAEIRKLGWQSLQGWWHWQIPGQEEPVHFCHDTLGSINHKIRESIRHSNLILLEKRRPRQYAGIQGAVQRDIVAKAMANFTSEEELQLA